MKQDNILSFLCTIPYGKVVSYKSLGRFFHLHPRAIAVILSQNKDIETFPCFKVVNSNGGLGGYNQGIDEKIRKLSLEGILAVNGRIPREYFWEPDVFE